MSATGSPKLLLPPQGVWDRFTTAMKGAYSVIVDKNQRDALERIVEEKIIDEKVLERANSGAMLMFGLFQSLQDPLWTETNSTDPKEFLSAAPAALENFHDVLGRVGNATTSSEESSTQSEADKGGVIRKLDEKLIADIQKNPGETLLGQNKWREQAENDPESPASLLSRMVTPPCFDAFYFTRKIDFMATPPGVTTEYENGSAEVSQVALLGMRAQYLLDSEEHEEEREAVEHEEFKATDASDPPVVAQIDLLYEVTQSYIHSSPYTDDKEATAAATDSSHKNEFSDDGIRIKKERISYTNIAVAVFEGWLRGGPENKLTWRLAMLREPHEFPLSPPTLTREDL